jgi:light-regulated signal transduction histidine kinase (bacteriophytochrome)
MQPIAERIRAAELSQPAFLLDAILNGLVVAREIAAEEHATQARARQRDELARLTAELEQLTRVLAYDLQEPLRKVASYTELLSKRHAGRLGEEADELVAEAAAAVERVRALSGEVRAYSRAGAVTFVPTSNEPAVHAAS